MSSVDVVIPSYNYGRYLPECVESVLRQDGVDLRVLVIDDCSSDNTSDVAAELVHQGSRVEYRRHTINRGHINTYNEGIDWAQSDYLIILSADDLLAPGALYRAAAVMDAHVHIGFTFGSSITFTDGDPIPESHVNDIQNTQSILSGVEFIERVCAGNVPLPVSVVVRTALQKRLGGWRTDLPHAGDPEMWLRFAAHAPVGMLGACQGFYRRHQQNMSDTYRRRPLEDWQENNRAYNIFFDQHGHRLVEAARLREFRAQTSAQVGMCKAMQAFERGQTTEARAWFDALRDFYPPVCSWPAYSRLRWKLRLGYSTCRLLSPALAVLSRLWGNRPYFSSTDR